MEVRQQKRDIPSIIVVIAVVLMVIMFFSGDSAVNDLKDIVFDQYTSMEFGDVVEKNLSGVKWSSEKIDSDCYEVTVTGFSRELSSDISATFRLNYVDDMVYAQIDHVVMNGEYADDFLSLGFVMAILCG